MRSVIFSLHKIAQMIGCNSATHSAIANSLNHAGSRQKDANFTLAEYGALVATSEKRFIQKAKNAMKITAMQGFIESFFST